VVGQILDHHQGGRDEDGDHAEDVQQRELSQQCAPVDGWRFLVILVRWHDVLLEFAAGNDERS
jgi:hypothetical protein